MQKAIAALKQLLENTVANPLSPLHDVKQVFFGDPVLIPEDNLPALIIQPTTTQYTMRGSRYDMKQHSLIVSLVYNQKMYFDKNVWAAKPITGAVFSAWAITFTCVGHGLFAGKTVHIEKMKPEAYNGTFTVSSVVDANTFTVQKISNPWAVTVLGEAKSTSNDKVFAVEDAILKVEKQGEYHETAALSVCGTIQQHSTLPFTDAEGTKNAAELAKVVSVEYAFNQERGFPTFEVKTTVEVICVGDR